ncbi:MAG TPA: sigma-70 family RNA polymerase sigma factor [Tepidisphaeraceae bacterium]|nr:sigma-70 family RNA polymerase sigma factor [Tepidisphaeraceae bacterium]
MVSSTLRSNDEIDDVNRIPQTADDELLRRYSESGSEEAFSQIVNRHAGWVYHFCRRRLNDSHLAEDATQAVFLLLARKIPTMPPPPHVAGWLFQACRYVLAETRRNDKRYRRRQDIARDVMLQRISAASAADAAPDPHLSAALDDALVRLRANERQTILMHFYEGLTLRQMADQLGISKEGAKKRVNRALAHLRRSLEGKIHRIKSRPSVAGAVVILWLLQSRRSEAAPTDLAETVAKSATVPGVSSSMAELMVHGVAQSMARARHKLLATLLLLILELVLIVPIAILRGRGPHNLPQIAAAPAGGTAQMQSGAPAITPSRSQLSTVAKEPETWLDPDGSSPLPRPYAPPDDTPPAPQKVAADQPKEITKEPTPVARAEPVNQGGPLPERAAAVAPPAGVGLPVVAVAPTQSAIVKTAPAVAQFSQIRSTLLRKTHTADSPILIPPQENCPQPPSREGSDNFRFPPPPPPDARPPFDPFPGPPRSRPAFAFDPRDILEGLPEQPHREHQFDFDFNRSGRFAPEFASLLPSDMPPPFEPHHQFLSMPEHAAFAAMSESIGLLDDHFFVPGEHILADYSAPHLRLMSPVPEPRGALFLLIASGALWLRRTRKRSDAS